MAAPEELEVDEDGIRIQKYRSMVLLVVPERDYAEEAMRYARSSLYNVHVGTYSVSTCTDKDVIGRLQDEFMVDGPIANTSMESYSGVIFSGGEGAADLAQNQDCLRLAREADEAGKLIGAWGHSVEVLVAAGVLKGKRFTGPDAMAAKAKSVGGKFTAKEVEADKHLVTGRDDAVGMRFGQRLAQVVGI